MDGISLLIAGAIAGGAHVALAPDHVVALLVFSAEARSRAWRVGLYWGLGHAGAIALVALAVLQVREWLDWHFLTDYGEYVAGVMLIAIGSFGLYDLARGAAQGLVEPEKHADKHGHVHTRLAFVAGFTTGAIHSVAGNGVLLATIPALGLSPGGARQYLLAFSVATVASVVALASLLGWLSSLPFRQAARLRAYQRFLTGVALCSIALGVLWLVLAWSGLEVHPYLPG